jgi:hypothetical protein
VTSPDKARWEREKEGQNKEDRRGRVDQLNFSTERSPPRKNNLRSGTFTRRPRALGAATNTSSVPLGTGSKKRGPKQVWLPVEVRVVGEGTSEIAGKRQRTNSVFDRLEDPKNLAVDPAGQGRRGQ